VFKQGHRKTFRPAAPYRRPAPPRTPPETRTLPRPRAPRARAQSAGASCLRRSCWAQRLPAQQGCQPPIRALAPRRAYELPPPPPWPQSTALPPGPSRPPAPVEAAAVNPGPNYGTLHLAWRLLELAHLLTASTQPPPRRSMRHRGRRRGSSPALPPPQPRVKIEPRAPLDHPTPVPGRPRRRSSPEFHHPRQPPPRGPHCETSVLSEG
jgi:hypothetical protein